MKRILAASAALMMATHSAQAKSYEDAVANWNSLTPYVIKDSVITAMWVDLLATITTDCPLTLDRDKMVIVTQRDVPDVDWMDFKLSRYQSGQFSNPMVEDWNAMKTKDMAAMCQTADRMWGEKGEQLVGILQKQ